MLAREYHSFETRVFQYRDPLLDINCCWIEFLFRFASHPPFTIGESIDREVNESIHLHVMPIELRLCRDW